MTESDYLLQQIRLIQEEYQKQVQPYIDRLARCKALQPVVINLTAEQLSSFQKIYPGKSQ